MEILKSKVKMSMFGGSGLPSGIHGDVLNADPSEPAEVERLVEEIKGRAKNSIKYGNFPEGFFQSNKRLIFPEDAKIPFQSIIFS